ncbi:transmembrane protein 115-like [Lineus longissimus]|uniref:transmembrane protein 115-like n=1 Tax=Lineus longissimus TaxID=88925 RepID=UPI002B4FAB94
MATSMVQRNLPYVKQQFTAALGNSSVVVKFISVAVFGCYFLSFSEAAISYTTVTPGYVLPPNFWVWTYLTFSFIEAHVWIMLFDVAVIVFCGKLLEPLWGALEMLIFYLLVNISVAAITTSVYVFVYFVSKNEDYLFHTHINGLAGYIGGFAVAVKQIMPDNILVNSPFGKLRNRHIPILLLIIAIMLRLAGALDGPYPIMFGAGILVSWTYLRFYQKHSNGNRGDMADNFTFASFFPDTLQPVIGVISNTIFSFLVKIKACKKPQRKYDVSSPTTITVSLPGTDPQDADRRRQLALKALNERLSKTDPQVNWPSMDEGEATKKEGEKSKDIKEGSPSASKLPVPDFKENAKHVDDDVEVV